MFDAIHFDITRPSDYQEAYKYFDKNFGRLDILINNAGVSKELIGVPNNASSVSQAILRETFDTNFFGTIELTQALLPLSGKLQKAGS
jgi:NAD(P)-dependent dehydrogenase (short-subunit alcohol dehydrogenase family)